MLITIICTSRRCPALGVCWLSRVPVSAGDRRVTTRHRGTAATAVLQPPFQHSPVIPSRWLWDKITPLITFLSWLQPSGPAHTAPVHSNQLSVCYGSFRASFPQPCCCHPAFRAVSPACHQAGCATGSLTQRSKFWGVV